MSRYDPRGIFASEQVNKNSRLTLAEAFEYDHARYEKLQDIGEATLVDDALMMSTRSALYIDNRIDAYKRDQRPNRTQRKDAVRFYGAAMRMTRSTGSVNANMIAEYGTDAVVQFVASTSRVMHQSALYPDWRAKEIDLRHRIAAVNGWSAYNRDFVSRAPFFYRRLSSNTVSSASKEDATIDVSSSIYALSLVRDAAALYLSKGRRKDFISTSKGFINELNTLSILALTERHCISLTTGSPEADISGATHVFPSPIILDIEGPRIDGIALSTCPDTGVIKQQYIDIKLMKGGRKAGRDWLPAKQNTSDGKLAARVNSKMTDSLGNEEKASELASAETLHLLLTRYGLSSNLRQDDDVEPAIHDEPTAVKGSLEKEYEQNLLTISRLPAYERGPVDPRVLSPDTALGHGLAVAGISLAPHEAEIAAFTQQLAADPY